MSPTKPKHNTSKKAAPKAAQKAASKAAPKAAPKLAPKLAPKDRPVALSASKIRRGTDTEREVHALEPSQLTRSERPQLVATGDGNEGRYVYGVIQTKEPMTFGKIGMGGSG